MSWQTILQEILNGYFGDQTIEEGVTEMIFVTESNLDYHQSYLSALEAGIEAASQGQQEVVRFIMDSYAWHIKDTVEAREFLERLRSEYIAQYDAATRDDPL